MTPHTILIIEDEQDLREALTAVLEESGYTVQSSSTSADGLERVSESKPDLIFLDIMTHSLHGIEFLKRLRALPPDKNDSKVIVLTNLDNDITREQMVDYRIDEYMVKAHHSLQEIADKAKTVLRVT